jgi:putative transposase
MSIGICARNMPCKYCLSETVKPAGSMRGKRLVKCVQCGKRFYDNENLPSMKINKGAIVSALSLYFEGLSVRKVSRQLEAIYGEKVNQSTVWRWVQKYSHLVSEYTRTLSPQLGGKWHHDETVIKCEGQNQYFWETIDEDTRFIVATYLSETRTLEETKEAFRRIAKAGRPIALFTDGSVAYDEAFHEAFHSHFKASRVEWVRRVGIRARETNNIVERLHETVKERVRPMRGLKNQDSARNFLDGYVVNYNFARPHMSLKGQTPAQVAGIEVKGWKALIEGAYQAEVLNPQTREETAVEVVQVARQ